MDLKHIRSATTLSLILESDDKTAAQTELIELGRRLNCLGLPQEPCANCRRVKQGNAEFIDLIGLTTKTAIGIEAVRDLKNRLAIALPTSLRQRVVIINRADQLTLPAANAILKLAEEPPPKTIIGFVCQHSRSLPATLRSRCQLIPLVTHQPEPSNADDVISWFQLPVFVRLAGAAKLAAASDPLDLSTRLQRATIAAAGTSPDIPALTQRLESIEKYRRYTQSGVGVKAALENLMLEYN